ncbi:uncharacterized protein [Lolium perenne]|uniref:uncharacterized protein n=1 Tax=Lolium perenne TaxID=4522 RepID=UPI003A98E191
MSDWGPVVIAVVLFVLLSPGLLLQLPGKHHLVEFGNMHTSAMAILVPAARPFRRHGPQPSARSTSGLQCNGVFGRRIACCGMVIHRAASLIHLWSYLLPVEQREPLDTGCNRLMAVVRAIFSQGGWLQSRRIGDGT